MNTRTTRNMLRACLAALAMLFVAGWALPAQAASLSPGGTWQPTGSMISPRIAHVAALMQNGKVLVAGGFDGTNILASAEIYDPAAAP